MATTPPKITYSQTERLLNINTTMGETEVLLEKFSGTEALSTPFEFKVALLSPDFSLDLKSLLRTSATVTIFLADGSERVFNAVFRSLAQAKEGEEIVTEREAMGITNPHTDLATYEGILVPQVWFLSLDCDCKIFQSMTVPDIVGSVLKDKGVSNYAFRTNGTYPEREYCVQYRESSLHFISRLLEEEGIFYFFEHTETEHTMVFADNSSLLPACPNQATAQYSYDKEGWVGEGQEGVASLERIETAYTGKVALTDYYFETPSLSLMATLADENEEAYDYPGEYTTLSDGERYARIRLEEREALQFVVNGSSRCRAFRAGCYFKLEGHFRTDTNLEYFLTSVTHQAFDSTYRQDKDKSHDYTNTFTAIPKTVPYRPPRKTMRPTVHGMQPALVVGKKDEEIWVDNYGRVKVQFYWDRVGQKNENSSCWIRVSQIWAGKSWGWVTIPRIGQEVLVDFLEGDPDRPIIVGRVYNADQTTPYTLPDNQTQSGIKTRSSKGGTSDNYNELRFEDLKGQEMITFHAEKDMSTSVEHDDTQLVQNNRTINVDGTHTETIVKDTTITITQGNHSTTLNAGNQTITLDKGNQTTTVSLGSISMTAMQSITLTVGASSITIDQEGISIVAPTVEISGDMLVEVESDTLVDIMGDVTMINCG
ncbi:MAG TPA: type VI secretion system tip protein TssI/VgrG [Bryobacteraceae bacterium]|nr:type VI secretion system tip protein TssI/VgrG [Bryobacteraceae bacterium]